MSAPKKTSTFKLLMTGSERGGKTSLGQRMASDMFQSDYAKTIGADFFVKSVFVDGRGVKFELWDTAGNERDMEIQYTYYRGVGVSMIVYDISDRGSFEELEIWRQKADQCLRQEVLRIVVGAKNDVGNRAVTREEAERYARSHGMTYIETSAKNGCNVEGLSYIILAEMMLQDGNKSDGF
eukprot:CAMPEP_0115023540 /NCGR_PEP_ID=MMETSP0216-20121206/32477_1 /TAXON_ID=223996 /ORGANISM="Protocruzia adherens, Strain Boccale" /LENGTH=180 /DNA_ID=CAMNT_0002396975 /DNA_START=12 /DNA_END=554 /DNA_ORIENTATION=+